SAFYTKAITEKRDVLATVRQRCALHTPADVDAEQILRLSVAKLLESISSDGHRGFNKDAKRKRVRQSIGGARPYAGSRQESACQATEGEEKGEEDGSCTQEGSCQAEGRQEEGRQEDDGE